LNTVCNCCRRTVHWGGHNWPVLSLLVSMPSDHHDR